MLGLYENFILKISVQIRFIMCHPFNRPTMTGRNAEYIRVVSECLLFIHPIVVNEANLEHKYKWWCYLRFLAFCIVNSKDFVSTFLIKQLNPHLPEQMHFPFCFFCFSVISFPPFFNPKSIWCLFSIRFTIYSWCYENKHCCKVSDAIWKTEYLKLQIAVS